MAAEHVLRPNRVHDDVIAEVVGMPMRRLADTCRDLKDASLRVRIDSGVPADVDFWDLLGFVVVEEGCRVCASEK